VDKWLLWKVMSWYRTDWCSYQQTRPATESSRRQVNWPMESVEQS